MNTKTTVRCQLSIVNCQLNITYDQLNLRTDVLDEENIVTHTASNEFGDLIQRQDKVSGLSIATYVFDRLL